MKNLLEQVVIDGVAYEAYKDTSNGESYLVIKGLDAFGHIKELIDKRSWVPVYKDSGHEIIQFIDISSIDNESITVSYRFYER